ncbi:late competence protein ComER [Brevibacillus sp. SYP-B805]|uniref:late competence protein ComER n=1 Tax=Brevibacillus sp. SYP-B805 TaxID=1578199 RepID=UPI0013EC801C|nr:late competence protein ComER [Brevibacillus sp. SYP-B805]NGQ94171.1 late competence protein ComER [Brevibacillus sp. SYP-B805]
MHIGFVGTGSMGSLLIDAFIAAQAVPPRQIIASNRTLSKAEKLAERHPGLQVAGDNTEVARSAQLLLLCVKPFEYRQALNQLREALSPEHILVTITSPVKLHELEQLVPCQVIRVVPSITNAAHSGLTLFEYGERTTPEARSRVLSLFSRISCPLEVEEKFLRIASDISSCGPAFVSYILQHMIQSAVEETGISREAATFLTTQMIIGFADLLKREIFTLPALQERVCVPGGITGEGLIALENSIPGVFNEVFRRTHAKFAEDRHEMSSHLLADPTS